MSNLIVNAGLQSAEVTKKSMAGCFLLVVAILFSSLTINSALPSPPSYYLSSSFADYKPADFVHKKWRVEAGLGNGFEDLFKKQDGDSQPSGGMGKRAWNSQFSGGMGKRAWNSQLIGGMGKMAWNNQFTGGMGKRAWNSHFSGGMGKRGWIRSFSGGLGK